ncbi:MAG TPA: saccharopine dehydrogenase NADP-binding domain-containing protein [Verrucomicrobiota bacterium]|nr:saccharopine dehydrogenase NADP-binding domain-containing protein [Verrucomicrobiota bacterium]HQL79472.1 saccharopine dehydrogenase NADP-binding domain-containing protein [Verrucomicrobiota bacterium]
MRIFILGAGATGGWLAQLLGRRGHTVWCGDRNPERARRFAGRSFECRAANGRSLRSVVRAARGCQLLVNAAPAVFNETVLRAALRLRVHYLDLASHLSRNPFKAEQLRFEEDFARRGRLALINAGVAPGLTNLLVAACADTLEEVDHVRIRLFEDIESDGPVSSWSAEVAHDEAISRPRVYRDGRFRLARRFSGAEWFRFPQPIGESRVVLAAQDEAATLPRFIEMKHLDVKIGGSEMERLRRWYRQGKLRTSGERVNERFPDTATPAEVAELMRRGKLQNARFAVCVVVSGRRGGRRVERRRSCVFPSLARLRRAGVAGTPIAFATAQCAAVFVDHFPRHLAGVYPPEALSARVRAKILRGMNRRGFRFQRGTARLAAEEPETSHV